MTGIQKEIHPCIGVYVILETCGDDNYVQLFHRAYVDKEKATGNVGSKYVAIAFKLHKDLQYYHELLKMRSDSQAVYDFEFDLHRQKRINWTSRIDATHTEQEKLETGHFTLECMLRKCDKHPLNEDREEECPFKANLFQVKLESPCAFACGKNSLGFDVQRHLVPIFPKKEHGWLPDDLKSARAVLRS